jgi:hypothetical protein
MMPRDVMARRDREFAEAKSARDVDMLQRKWQAEDAAAAAAADWRNRELIELRGRVAALERALLSKNGRGLSMHVCQLLGDVFAGLKKDILKKLEPRIAKLEERQVRFCGVHQIGASYEPGSLVTKAGGLWHASKATRESPGQSSDWSLCVKSKSLEKEPVVA